VHIAEGVGHSVFAVSFLMGVFEAPVKIMWCFTGSRRAVVIGSWKVITVWIKNLLLRGCSS
jgi:hypothetical protein